jgi:hypothetical protein
MSFIDRIFPSTAAPAGAASPGPEGAGPGPGPDGVGHSCPECGTPAAHDQEWCLECGSRIEETTPRWHQPAAVMASVGLILIAGLALALSEVAKDAEVAKAKTVRKYVAAAPAPAAPAAPVPASPTPDAPKASSDPGASTPETSPNTTDTPAAVPSDAGGAASSSPDTGTSSGSSSGSSDTGSSGTSSGSGGSSGGGGGSSGGGGGGSTTTAPAPVEEWPAGKKAYSVILLSTTSKDEAEALARKARAKGVPAGILETSKYKNLSDGLWMVWAGRFGTEDEAYAATDGYSAKGFTGESVEYVREKGSEDSSDNGSGTGGSDSDGKTTSTEGKTTSTETSPAGGGG